MPASISHGYHTAMTITAIEDLGYYQGDYAKAEIMSRGKDVGCELFTDMCLHDSVSIDEPIFCTDMTFNQECTSAREAVGVCRHNPLSTFPSWMTNYGLDLSEDETTMDLCPYWWGDTPTHCLGGDITALPDSKFGDSSRCPDVSSGVAVCAAITCNSDQTYKVQFQCGSAVAIPGTSRTATCPPYIEVCDAQCGSECASSAALTTMATGCSGVLLALLTVLSVLV